MNADKKRRNIVARVMSAENKADQVIAEAKRAGVSTRTVERWVEAAQKSTVRQDVVSENVDPAEKTAENPVLDTLLKEEGGPGKAVDGPPTPGEIQQASADAERICLDAYGGMKSAVGSVLVSMRFTPPLDATSPEVLKMLRVGTAAELAIRTNTPKLYPLLMKYASNWGALILAVSADAFGMIAGLEGMAKAKGWAPGPKKSGDKPRQVEVPSERDYGEALRPKPAPDPEPPVAAAKPGMDTVVDAPLPTPEAVAKVDEIRALLTGTN